MSASFENGLQILYNPLGHEQVTVTDTPVGLPNLPDPSRLRRAVIRNAGPEDADLNWRDDGVDPTTTTGMFHKVDDILIYDGDFDAFKMVRISGVSADVRIAYYGL